MGHPKTNNRVLNNGKDRQFLPKVRLASGFFLISNHVTTTTQSSEYAPHSHPYARLSPYLAPRRLAHSHHSFRPRRATLPNLRSRYRPRGETHEFRISLQGTLEQSIHLRNSPERTARTPRGPELQPAQDRDGCDRILSARYQFTCAIGD